jgi:hypothetical protein
MVGTMMMACYSSLQKLVGVGASAHRRQGIEMSFAQNK